MPYYHGQLEDCFRQELALNHQKIADLLGHPLDKIRFETKSIYNSGTYVSGEIFAPCESHWHESGEKVIIEGTALRMKLQEIPGCCGALHLFEWFRSERVKGKGIVEFFVKLVERVAYNAEYAFLQATDQKHQKGTKHILVDKCGWEVSTQFYSHRTSYHINVFRKALNDNESEKKKPTSIYSHA